MSTNTNASQPTGASAQVARLARAATDFRAWEVQEAKDEANTFPVPRGDVFSTTVETPEAAADSGNHPRQPTQTSYFCTRESEASSPSPSTDDVHSNITPAISSSSTDASAKTTISKIPTTIIVGGCVVVTVAAVVYWYNKLLDTLCQYGQIIVKIIYY
jgi:cobalamin biosynthesis Mg chelatase CobN